MSDMPEAAMTTKRSRLAHKWSQFLMWWPPLRWMWTKLAIYVFPSKYTEHPQYSPILAGLHELFWSMVCGSGWKQVLN